MSEAGCRCDFAALRAPSRDGEVLIAPPHARWESAVGENRRLLAAHPVQLLGRDLAPLAAEARRELLAVAVAHTGRYRDLPPRDAAAEPAAPGGPSLPRVLLCGHQPELFHPGVWLKNFVLDGAARRLGAAAVHLLIDNDLVRSAAVRVPAGDAAAPEAAAIAFDDPHPPVPYEERRILCFEQFRSFGQRLEQAIGPLVADPLVRDYWPRVLAAAEGTDRLGRCLAQARHQLEAQWGLETLEAPLGAVCETPSFCRFAAWMLACLPRLHAVYNDELARFRRERRIRSRTHPAPALARQGARLEAPLWLWTADDPRRRPAYVEPCGRERLRLTDGGGLSIELPLSPEADPAAAVSRLVELPREGVRLRPRALITTMYARLLLSDLFLHGIGGAKYDRLTDRILTALLERPAPQMAVVSGTLTLGVPHAHVEGAALTQIDLRLRQLTYHPECFLAAVEDAAAARQVALLANAKRDWIAQSPPRGAGRERHRQIARINAELQPYLAAQRAALLAQRAQCAALRRACALLDAREYAFCAHDRARIRDWLLYAQRESG